MMPANRFNKPTPKDDMNTSGEKKSGFFVTPSQTINIFTMYSEMNQLFVQYLEANDSHIFQEALTKLDHLILILEQALSSGGIPVQYVLAAQCYYFKAACLLMAASEKGDEQIMRCHESQRYLKKAFEYGFRKNDELAVLSNFSETLEQYYIDLRKTLASYHRKVALTEEKERRREPIKYSLRFAVGENQFFNSLEKHCTVGFITLNKEISEKAIEMMRKAISKVNSYVQQLQLLLHFYPQNALNSSLCAGS